MEGYLNTIGCADADAHGNMLLRMDFMEKGSANNADSEVSPPGSPLFLEDLLLKDSPAWSFRPRSHPAKTDAPSLRDCPVAPPDIRGDASPEERLFEIFTPTTQLKDVATCPHTESGSQGQLPKDEDKIGAMIASLTTARLSDILPLPEPIPDWRKVRFHGFPVNYPEMNCRMYTEGRSAALKSINAHESLVEFLRTSFTSASATFAGVPAHARAPVPDSEAYRAPQIVDLDDNHAAFHQFSSALLVGWLLYLTEIGFVDPVVGEEEEEARYAPNWEQLSSLASEIPLQYGMLGGSPDDYVYDTFDRLSSEMYDALATHFSGWSGWTMFDRLWNVCEPDPVVFTYNSIPHRSGFYSCSLTGRMIPEDPTSRDQVLYVYIPEDVGMDDDGNEVRTLDGIYTIYLDGYGHSGYGGAKEKVNIFKYVQAVYDLGHMSAGSVSRFHEVFMKRYFPQGVTECHDMEIRAKAIDDAVGSCWGLTENYDGIKVIFDLFSRYVRAAWLIDHVMSAHNPTVKDGHWYYNIARVTSFSKDSEEAPPPERPLGRDEGRAAIYPPKEDRMPIPKKGEKKEEEKEEDDQYTYDDDDLFGSGGSSSSSDTPIQVVSLPPKQNGERPSVYALAHLFVNIRRDVQAVRALLPAHPLFMDGVIGDMEAMTDTIGPSLGDAIRGMDRAYGDIYKAGTAATRAVMNI